MATTRSSPQVWLLGKPEKDILGASLPTNRAILKNFMYHHCEMGLTIAESAKATIDAAMIIWEKARIPTQRADSGVRKLRKLYDEYCELKKSRLSQKEGCRVKEELFKGDLDALFDISRKDALSNLKNDEDKQFLQMQKEDPSSSSMAGVDYSLAKMEARKSIRNAQAAARKERSAARIQQDLMTVPTVSSTSAVQPSSTSASSSDSDDDFQAPSTSCQVAKPSSKKRTVVNKEVAAALDRVKLPDRGAMHVVGAVTQALGFDLDEVVLSRNSIKRARVATRKEVATAHQDSFSPDGPLLLHWDGKLLPDIAGSKELVDRVAILVTGGQMEQLLAVPSIESGTGEEQCSACIRALEDWQLKPFVQGMVFDTTAANTGLKMGACTLIEKALGKELVWIACRHHIFEIMLSEVFFVALGPANGPEIALFKRFQSKWPHIDKVNFVPAGDEILTGMPDGLRREMTLFYADAMKGQMTREDYRELLQLCYVFLGGSCDGLPSFRATGAMHNARWMAKAIYSLKIFLSRDR